MLIDLGRFMVSQGDTTLALSGFKNEFNPVSFDVAASHMACEGPHDRRTEATNHSGLNHGKGFPGHCYSVLIYLDCIVGCYKDPGSGRVQRDPYDAAIEVNDDSQPTSPDD